MSLYNSYQMVLTMLQKYRKYELVSPELSKQEFKEKMAKLDFVKIKVKTKTSSGRSIVVFLAKENSNWIRKSDDFRYVMDQIKKEPMLVIIISGKSRLHILFKKIIPEYPDIKFQNYSIDHFRNELPKGPHCSKHSVLSKEEIKTLFEDGLHIQSPLDLPRILSTDPQIIWIGAEPNSIVRINTKSKITGQVTSYRLVIDVGEELKSKPDTEEYEEEQDYDEEEIFDSGPEINSEDEEEQAKQKKEKSKSKSKSGTKED